MKTKRGNEERGNKFLRCGAKRPVSAFADKEQDNARNKIMRDYQPPQSVSELIRRYQSGERYFGCSELDKFTCDFRGVDLSEVDFSHSFLVADFREADLRSVNFSHCNIKTCNFRGADLRGAIFREAALESTQFAGAILDGSDFEGASVFSQRLGAGDLPDW